MQRRPTSRSHVLTSSNRPGGTFSDVTERLGAKGESAAERVLDELILARVRFLTKAERTEFLAHVRDLVDLGRRCDGDGQGRGRVRRYRGR